MKVTFIIGTLGGGGAERVISNIIGVFEEKGVNTSIVTLYGNSQAYTIDKRTEILNLKRGNIPIIRRIYTVVQLRKVLSKSKSDIIISFLDQVNIQVGLAYLGLVKPPKLIFAERNDPTKEPNNKWIRKLRNILYKRVDGISYQTYAQKEYFKDIVPAYITQSIIENPIKKNLPKYEGINSNYFIAAGRFVQQKNYTMMINAFKRIIDDGYTYKLMIYGDGPLKESIKEYILSQGLEDYIILNNFSPDIHSLMASAKGYLLSSDFEGISNSMLEALAIGVPVVSTDYPSGGARMYIKNKKTGFIVPRGNVTEFYKAIKSIIEDNNNALCMASEASKIRDTLTPELITQKWIRFIYEICSNEGNEVDI